MQINWRKFVVYGVMTVHQLAVLLLLCILLFSGLSIITDKVPLILAAAVFVGCIGPPIWGAYEASTGRNNFRNAYFKMVIAVSFINVLLYFLLGRV